METKTIRVNNVKEKEGQYGPSLQIGHKVGDDWVNYFVNDTSLFDYFKKGEAVTIEYEQKGNWNIVKGVSAAAKASGNGSNGNGSGYHEEPGKQRSIELQVCLKAWAEVAAGKEIVPAEFAAAVTRIWTDVFGDPLESMKQKAVESMGATEDPDDLPF